jgi:hypothetical protein
MPICESSTPGYGGSSGGVGNPSGTTETNGGHTVDFSGWWGFNENATATNTRYQEEFKRAGKALDVDWRLISALAQQESEYDETVCNESDHCGLYQYDKPTWRDNAEDAYKNDYEKRKDAHIATTTLIKHWTKKKSQFCGHIQNINDQTACIIQCHHDGSITFKNNSSGQKWEDVDLSNKSKAAKQYLSLIIDKYHKLCQ